MENLISKSHTTSLTGQNVLQNFIQHQEEGATATQRRDELDHRKPEKESSRPTGNKYSCWLIGRGYVAQSLPNCSLRLFFIYIYFNVYIFKTGFEGKFNLKKRCECSHFERNGQTGTLLILYHICQISSRPTRSMLPKYLAQKKDEYEAWIPKAPAVKKEQQTADRQKQGRLQRPPKTLEIILQWVAFAAFILIIRHVVIWVALEVDGLAFAQPLVTLHLGTAQNQVLFLRCGLAIVHFDKLEWLLADAQVLLAALPYSIRLSCVLPGPHGLLHTSITSFIPSCIRKDWGSLLSFIFLRNLFPSFSVVVVGGTFQGR